MAHPDGPTIVPNLGRDVPSDIATTAGNGSSSDAAPMDHTHGPGTLSSGVVPSARLTLDAQPTNGDTVVVGGHTFKFVTSLAAVTTFTQLKIGASNAGASARALLVKAFNKTVDAANITYGTVAQPNLLADEIDTNKVRVRNAPAPGGAATAAAAPSVALAATITGAATDVWNMTNLSASAGKAVTKMARGMGSIAITAAMVTAAKVFVEFNFTPKDFIASVLTSAGVPREITTDAFSIVANSVQIGLAGGGAPSLQATDVVTIFAWE